MSAVMTRRRAAARGRDREPYRQASLFGQIVSPPPLEVDEPIASPDDEDVRVGPLAGTGTLDAAMSALWNDLHAGEPAACPICGGELEPQRSPGSGAVVGGRCGTCSATLA
jgi:hypothetical protein